MTPQPQTRLEVLQSVNTRMMDARLNGNEFVILETWEAFWIVKYELDRLGMDDSDGTGQLVSLDFADVTTPHKVRIAGPESFIGMVNCDEDTEPYKTQPNA